MSDELAAFFAKKASKGKKKGVIKLQEVADQLERRAKFQDELDEQEAKASEEAAQKQRASNDINNEDSEWLEFDDKPNIPMTIKEMITEDIESEEEEKRSSVEPTKTWNLGNENADETTPPPSNQEKGKFVPKSMRKALDISNENQFPTLGNAAEVEKEQKKAEEERIREEIEEKRREEQKKREEEARPKPYRPRHQDGESPRKTASERKQAEPSGPTEEEGTDDWRNKPAPPPSEERPKRAIKSSDMDGDSPRRQPERRQPDISQSEAEQANTWRSSEKTTQPASISEKVPRPDTKDHDWEGLRKEKKSDAKEDSSVKAWRGSQQPKPTSDGSTKTNSPEREWRKTQVERPVEGVSSTDNAKMADKPNETKPESEGKPRAYVPPSRRRQAENQDQ